MTLPDLADRVADNIYTERLSIAAASKVLPIGHRAELQRWRAKARTLLLQLLTSTPKPGSGRLYSAAAQA